MKRNLLVVVVASLALALPLWAACGGDDDAAGSTPGASTPTQEANSSAGDGAWRGEFDTGTKVTIEIFVDAATIPELAQFEAFREEVGYPPVRYARVTAQNGTGAADTARFATLTDDAADQFGEDAITLGFVCASAYRWIPFDSRPSEQAIAMYNELFSGPCVGQELAGPVIPPGQTITYYLVYDGEDEPEFSRVFMGLDQEFER